MILVRRQLDSGFRDLPEKERRMKTTSWANHLLKIGISPDKFEAVYELATEIYNKEPPKGPFGIDHMIQAALKMVGTKVPVTIFHRSNAKQLVSCSACLGTKVAYIRGLKGEVVGILRDEHGKILKCEACNNVGS